MERYARIFFVRQVKHKNFQILLLRHSCNTNDCSQKGLYSLCAFYYDVKIVPKYRIKHENDKNYVSFYLLYRFSCLYQS